MELFNDTVRIFEKNIESFLSENEYILSVEIIGKETLDYPFTLLGNETDIEINVNFNAKYDLFSEHKSKENGRVEILKYYNFIHNLDIQYLPNLKGSEYYKSPFFSLKNNSNDTIYGEHLTGYFWGSISFLKDSVWSNDYFGMLDYNFAGALPLFPDSVTITQVGSFGWRNDLPKNHYKYTLLYTTDKNISRGAKRYLETDNFVWWARTTKYYRLMYEFDIE
jgi:hypothetical protein